MHFRIQIKNATIVNEDRSFIGSLVIDDDRIDEVIEGQDAESSIPVDETINGEGCYLLPGVIDDHVHFRDPGLTQKGDFSSESRAAAAGGVTTVFDMPNCIPQTTTEQAFEEKWQIAASKSVVNYGLFFGATAGNAYELGKLNPRKVAGVKLFMGSSTGNMLVDNERALKAIFETAKLPVMAHCERTDIINENMKRAQTLYGSDPSVEHHPEIRSAEACYESTKQAISLAREAEARLHVAHISTARELDLFHPNDAKITAEACVGHLMFCDEDYARLGSRIKVNPSIKTRADRDALRALVSMLELVDMGVLSIERLVRLMCHNPADLLQIESRGYLREGYKADVVMVRPQVPWTLTPNRIQSKCNWSPLEGHVFHWRVERTFCNGFPIFNRGHITDENFRGLPVCYDR